MALTANEKVRGQSPVQDPDGRLIVVGPDGVPIGGGGGGSDPLSDGNDAGALPSKTLWIAGADGTVLRGVRVDSSGRIRTVVEGTPAVSVSNFPATQPVSGTVTANQGTPNSAANKWPVSVTDGTNTAQVLNAAPGSDSGQSAVAVRVISQLGAGSGGGGGGQADKSAFTEGTTSFQPVGGVLNETITADPTEDQAAAARITPKRAVHTNLRNNSGTEIATSSNPVRTDPTGTTTQPVSGTVTANAGTGPFPVSDNAGSLTVDAPVGTPVNVRLSDGAANYDGTKTGQLPSALVGGRLDVNIGASGLSSLAVANVETLADNAGFTDGTSKVFPQGYIFDEVAGTALTENDVAAGRIDSKRAIVNVIEDATTRGRRAIVTAESALLNAGDTAHDAVDAGNPVKTGAKASWPAIPTLVASADRTNNWSDLAGAQIIRKRPVAMYTAGYRLINSSASSRVVTSGALTANTNKQVATIYHTAGSTKRVQIKFVSVVLHGSTVAGTVEFEIQTLIGATAPSGGTTITPGKHDQGDSAAEAACLLLPTTAGTVTNPDQPVGDIATADGLGITTTPSTASPPPGPTKIILWDSTDAGDGKDLIMRAGNAEGYVIILRANSATNVTFMASIIFTEE
jgi:hypothetical protein